ncbi:hypothetical protein M405DRAFT_938225 [Rhizopogon salebrosus TDB-379]|nr:hypothetical protein M405DRAFT_938225 [Rhizopogon salebrosus TDB-379]
MFYGILVFGFLGTVLHLVPFSIGMILLRFCLHPFQNSHYMGETLPKAIVERIPLVIYIPPPPEDDGKAQPISLPKPVHRYPPKPPTLRMPRRRFAFFRRRLINKWQEGTDTLDGKQSTKSKVRDPQTWEDNASIPLSD